MSYNDILLVSSIPQEIKERNNWILWQKGEAKENNRFKKIPLNLNGSPWDKKSTWSFDVAFQTAHEKGLGIAFSLANTPYCVIDIDSDDDAMNRILHGYLMATFRHTYIERSISGRGYHIVVNDPGATHRFVESRLSLSVLCHWTIDNVAPWVILTGINPPSWLSGGVDRPIVACKLWEIPLMKEINSVIDNLQLADEEYEAMMAEHDDDPYYL
jgi:hypothetical protein